ncbi:MAG: hypothetical protein SOW08_05760 [Lachnospiraceae bacterium]|nr:hypothetical protein [Lachnospiraceae bacterium]
MKKWRSKEPEIQENPESPGEAEDPEKTEDPGKKPGKKKRRQYKKEQDQIVRIEELEKIMGILGEEADPESIVSMYMPRRKARRFGAALLRLDRQRLWLLGLLFLVTILFLVAFAQEKMGNFTINLNRLELYRKGIAISADGDFTDPTARLTANVVQDATNITLEDLPANIDEVDGDHNGRNYMAYTYYVRNAGKEDVGYRAAVVLDSAAKGAEEAVRVAVWRNGERIIYAEPAADGKEEEGCVSFVDHDTVCIYTEENFLVGNVDKYTIVIWMEGEDPECVDSIVGGSVEFSMNIDSTLDDDTSLLSKFVKDVADTLTGNKPIGAAGTDAPNYYNGGEITWKNRRNQ